MSRYIERAVSVVRLMEVMTHLQLDAGDSTLEDGAAWVPHLESDSLVSCLRGARTAAREVRDSISSEMWIQLNTTYLMLVEQTDDQAAPVDVHTLNVRVRDGLALLQGLCDSTLAHDEAWQFVGLGQYLERADDVARLLIEHGHLLTPGPIGDSSGDETVRWLAILRAAGCAEAYARYYSLRVEPARVLEFLLLNPAFPQSVRFSLGMAWNALTAIASSTGAPHDISPLPPVRALGLLRARLEHASVDEALESGLPDYLGGVQDAIADVSEQVTRAYFRNEPRVGRHMAVARAAQIMAAQQQQ